MSTFGKKRKQKSRRTTSSNNLPDGAATSRRDEPLLSVFDNMYESVYDLKTHYFSVDKAVGITARASINGVALPFWRVQDIAPGSQAHDFRIKRGAFIIYVNGERVAMNCAPLHELMIKAKNRSIEIGSEFSISFGQYRPPKYDQEGPKRPKPHENIDRKAREQALEKKKKLKEKNISFQNWSSSSSETGSDVGSLSIQSFDSDSDNSCTENKHQAKRGHKAPESYLNSKKKVEKNMSNSKEVDSVVYAEWSNGEYYKGTIQSVVEKRGKYYFDVLFTDGDKSSNLPDDKVVTEKEYYDGKVLEKKKRIPVLEDVLIGKCFRQEWIDIQNRTNTSYGLITKCFNVNGGLEYDIVISQQHSSYPKKEDVIRSVNADVALGGYISYLLKHSIDASMHQTSAHKIWRAPAVRYDQLDKKGKPRLILIYRGYELTFTVKNSSIKNAGWGVFVKCEAAICGHDSVDVLCPGEFLDIGIYAPLSKYDAQHSAIYCLKNFIFNEGPEEYAFDSLENEIMFDITDNSTGKPHRLAQARIPMYINEDLKKQTIHPAFDLEGNLHYLFGSSFSKSGRDRYSQPDLAGLNARLKKGESMELFVNYGEWYEPIRVRKGYSLFGNRKEDVVGLEEKGNPVKYIATYTEGDVNQCLEYFQSEFIPSVSCETERLDGASKSRAIDVAKALERKAFELFEESNASDRRKDLAKLHTRAKQLTMTMLRV